MGKVYDEHGRFHPGINYHAEAYMNEEPKPDLDEQFRALQKQLEGIFSEQRVEPTPVWQTTAFWFGVLQTGSGILIGILIGAAIWAG